MTEQTQTKFIKMEEVERRVSLARNTINRLIADGSFPAPVYLSPKRTAFVEAEVNQWMLERMLNARRSSFCDEEY